MSEKMRESWQPDMSHVANEWADTAINGLQWIRNIVDGISDPKTALSNMEECIAQCRQVSEDARAALRTHENGGQESEAGAWLARVKWLQTHKAFDASGCEYGIAKCRMRMDGGSEWLWCLTDASDIDEAMKFSGYEVPATSPAPPSAKAIETAAIMRCVEVSKSQYEAQNGGDDSQARRSYLAAVEDCCRAIIALIPKDGRTALEEFGMKVAEEVRLQMFSRYQDDKDPYISMEALVSIVTNLIGVPPLNSEGKE